MRSVLRAAGRLLRLAGYLVVGLWRARQLAGMPEAERLEAVRAWLAGAVSILGVTLEVRGQTHVDALADGGSLWLPNHISWLDIPLLGGMRPGTVFLAKSEIRHWPLIGRLASLGGTEFIQRGRGSEAAAAAVADGLAQRRQMVVFAEGTTSEGQTVRRFHARLIGPAIVAGAPVVPVAIRYRDADGQRTHLPAFVGRESLWPSLWRVLSARGLVARIDLLDPIDTRDVTRRDEIARQAHHAVSATVAADR